MKNLTINSKNVLVDFSMRPKGRGQYNIVAECNIDGVGEKFFFHTTDSELYDEVNGEQSFDDSQEKLFNRVENSFIKKLEDFIYNLN